MVQFYGRHHDANRAVGLRVLTAFLYLNEVESGGETNFTELPAVTASPRTGRLLMWSNVHDADPRRRHLGAYHEARPVRAGVKYAANLWLQQCPRGARHPSCVLKRDDE